MISERKIVQREREGEREFIKEKTENHQRDCESEMNIYRERVRKGEKNRTYIDNGLI
jgi:hypothetical protein